MTSIGSTPLPSDLLILRPSSAPTEKVESVWNFINKIWNGARFSLMNIGEDFKVEDIDLC
jgi:valyl-tRNA synthetase